MSNSTTQFEHLQTLLEKERWEEFCAAIGTVDPADLADFVEELPPELREAVFGVVDRQVASDMIVEIDSPYLEDIVDELESEAIADMAGRMAPDEAADLILELDSEQGEEVLDFLAPESKKEIQDLLQYDEDTAGGLMTSQVITCSPNALVRDVLADVAKAELADPVFYAYVVTPENGVLQGYVSIQELAVADPDLQVSTISHIDHVFSRTDEDQQEVARRFRKYGLWVMPVVDHRHVLVGRITVDDVIEVLHEEADEDLAHMVGAPDIEEEEDSLFSITRLRLPWLLITMFAGLLNSAIIRKMMDTTRIETLAIFVPVILAMGGNTGMQSSAVCIRGIALDEGRYKRLLTTVWREIRVGIALGLVCGLVTGLIVLCVLTFIFPENITFTPIRLAVAVGTAMTSSMTFASSFGALVPIVLHRLQVDPAVASGPFITTSNDLSATLIYFATCIAILGVM